jgi:hypothetical protein
MKQPHKHAKCIKAQADGAEIEMYVHFNNGWRTVDPSWDLNREYRIKPQPVVTRRYTFFDRIEEHVQNKRDLNNMTPQHWYDEPSDAGKMLEWTFTGGKLTNVGIKNATD